MPVYVPFMGHKEMAPPGATLRCQPLPHCPFLPIFYCPLLSFSLPTPHPGADLETTAFSQLLLAFPDLLPQPRKVASLAGLARAWLGPQRGVAGAGAGVFCQRRRGVEPPRIKEADPNNASCPLPASFSLSTAAAPWDRVGVGLGAFCLVCPSAAYAVTTALIRHEAATRGRRSRVTRDR